jgi:hypothetical protein
MNLFLPTVCDEGGTIGVVEKKLIEATPLSLSFNETSAQANYERIVRVERLLASGSDIA